MLSGVHSSSCVATAASASSQPDSKSRSDLVVSHHFAGFLRRSPRHRGCCVAAPKSACAESRGLVASRCQSWGSPRFWSSRSLVAQIPIAFPATLPTPRRLPPALSRTMSPWPLPSWRLRPLTFTPPAIPVAGSDAKRSNQVKLASKAFFRARVRTISRLMQTTNGLTSLGLLFPSKVPKPRVTVARVLRRTAGSLPRVRSRPVRDAFIARARRSSRTRTLPKQGRGGREAPPRAVATARSLAWQRRVTQRAGSHEDPSRRSVQGPSAPYPPASPRVYESGAGSHPSTGSLCRPKHAAPWMKGTPSSVSPLSRTTWEGASAR